MTVIRSPMNDESEYLSHYGILGMKWGHRKNRKSSKGILSKTSPKKTSKKKKTTKRIKDMTDAELIKRRERLRLEKEVKILTNESESTAKQVFKKAVTKAGQKVIEEIVHDTAKYLVGEQLINRYAGTKIVNIQTGNDDKKKKDKAA